MYNTIDEGTAPMCFRGTGRRNNYTHQRFICIQCALEWIQRKGQRTKGYIYKTRKRILERKSKVKRTKQLFSVDFRNQSSDTLLRGPGGL